MGSVSLVQHDLLANVNASTKLCNLTQSNGGNSKKKCPYVWYVNYRLGYTNKKVLGQQMEKVLIANDGWSTEGYPVRQPRIGWYTHQENSSFL